MKTKPDLRSILKEGKSGDTSVEHFSVSKNAADFFNLRCIINEQPTQTIRPGKYTRLVVAGDVMMSDTPMEWRTNLAFIGRAHGHVLIGGLGLGMVLPPILAKTSVKSVTVLEKSTHVLKLVRPYYKHRKLRVVEADVFTWVPDKNQKFDTIYMDIWFDTCADNLDEMRALRAHYYGWLNAKNRMSNFRCWRELETRAMSQASDFLVAAAGGDPMRELMVGGVRL
jgi:hypothetical protein